MENKKDEKRKEIHELIDKIFEIDKLMMIYYFIIGILNKK